MTTHTSEYSNFDDKLLQFWAGDAEFIAAGEGAAILDCLLLFCSYSGSCFK